MADMDHGEDKHCPALQSVTKCFMLWHLLTSAKFTPHQSVLLGGGPLASSDLSLSNQGLRLMTPLMTIISQDIKYRPTKVDHDTFSGFL